METPVQIFCRQVRDRSCENKKAIELLYLHGLYGNSASILRQELDSLIRVIFILNIPIDSQRNGLIEDAINGRQWRYKNGKLITDRDMVELATQLHGWAKSVYSFGCAFIHLSQLHDYQTRDAFKALSQEEQEQILCHLRYYHGGPLELEPTFNDITRYFYNVFNKISASLERHLQSLTASC